MDNDNQNETENKTPKIPYAVFYKEIKLPEENLSKEEVKEKYLLEIQGEYIELKESENILNSLFFFDLAHKYCPELVFINKTGEKFILFIHHNEPIIRDEKLKTKLIFEKWPKNDKEIEEKEVVFDLQDKSDNDIRKITRKIKSKFQKAIIKGGSILMILSTFHSLYGFAQEVYYQDKNNKLAKIR
uniref:Uncharacterized protein n=1 Tax=candidate division CPR3 bacterium TaxID=2268181 RepID=A0A7C4R869_UNCC3